MAIEAGCADCDADDVCGVPAAAAAAVIVVVDDDDEDARDRDDRGARVLVRD